MVDFSSWEYAADFECQGEIFLVSQVNEFSGMCAACETFILYKIRNKKIEQEKRKISDYEITVEVLTDIDVQQNIRIEDE